MLSSSSLVEVNPAGPLPLEEPESLRPEVEGTP